MSLSLFEHIHHDAFLDAREKPASIEEFVEFGLQPEDYVCYVGLQHILQGELILYGFPKAETCEKLIKFCKEKNLILPQISVDYCLSSFKKDDAEYYHGWLRYPKDPAEFRLCIERKMSFGWDEEEAYVTDVFGVIHFTQDSEKWLNGESQFMSIKKYDSEQELILDANRKDVLDYFSIAQEEKKKIEKDVAEHLAEMPAEHSVAAITSGVPWLKKLWQLWNRQNIVEDVYENIENALGALERLYKKLECSTNSPDAYIFKETDHLFVSCGTDTCKENNHLLRDVCVEFSFYSKPNKQYMIRRCSHCKQFQLNLQELDSIFDIYGVPQARIIYSSGENGDFTSFSGDSTLYKMGYSVSQSAGLSTDERRNILTQAIKTGKMSKYDVLSFLRRRININGMKEGNEIALHKWKSDYDYINQLKN